MCMDPTIKSEMGMLYLYFLPSRANPIQHRSTTMGVQLSCIRQDERQFTTGVIAHCKSHSTCYHTGTNKMKGGKKKKKSKKDKKKKLKPWEQIGCFFFISVVCDLSFLCFSAPVNVSNRFTQGKKMTVTESILKMTMF